MDVEKIFVDEKVVAALLSCSVQSLRNWRCLGIRIPYRKFGRSVRYYLPDVYEYVDSNKVDVENN